jgi:anti-sigma factor RsiW
MAGMNDCKNIRPRLSEYVDGALPADQDWAVRMHLASCAVCARVAEDFSAMARLLGELPRRETSAGFEAALARRLADQVLPPRRAWWLLSGTRLRPAVAFAGALAALVPAVFLATRHSPPGTETPAVPSEQQFVEQCLDEHAAYASAEPLNDSAAVLLAAAYPTRATEGARAR